MEHVSKFEVRTRKTDAKTGGPSDGIANAPCSHTSEGCDPYVWFSRVQGPGWARHEEDTRAVPTQKRMPLGLDGCPRGAACPQPCASDGVPQRPQSSGSWARLLQNASRLDGRKLATILFTLVLPGRALVAREGLPAFYASPPAQLQGGYCMRLGLQGRVLFVFRILSTLRT